MNKELREFIENFLDNYGVADFVGREKFITGKLEKLKTIINKHRPIVGKPFNGHNYCSPNVIADGNKGTERG